MTESEGWIDVTRVGSLYEEQENCRTGQCGRRPMAIDPTYPLGVRRDESQPWEVVESKAEQSSDPPWR